MLDSDHDNERFDEIMFKDIKSIVLVAKNFHQREIKLTRQKCNFSLNFPRVY